MLKKVRPFKKGSQFMFWYEINCGECSKANPETDNRSKTCPMEYDLALASVTDGVIPIDSAERIGIDEKYDTQVSLCLKCKEFQQLPGDK